MINKPIQLNMTTNTNQSRIGEGKQSRAVNRLLEVAEKHKILEEEWKSSDKRDLLRSTQGHISLPSKSSHYNKRMNHGSVQISQKQLEKQRLLQLIKDTINNEQETAIVKQANKSQGNIKEMNLTVKFIRNTKLKPFNSNMTFHGMKQNQKQRYIASSLNFYKRQAPNNSSQFDQSKSFRFIQNSELDYEGRYKQKNDVSSSKHVIYFKPNKSQTVRQLLNQMKHQKAKDNEVIINATDKKFYQSDMMPQNYDNVFSEQQLRVLSRYKKFVPFQKDQNLLWKKMIDGDNIWLQRFRQSWIKRKHEQQTKRPNFKKMIVKD